MGSLSILFQFFLRNFILMHCSKAVNFFTDYRSWTAPNMWWATIATGPLFPTWTMCSRILRSPSGSWTTMSCLQCGSTSSRCFKVRRIFNLKWKRIIHNSLWGFICLSQFLSQEMDTIRVDFSFSNALLSFFNLNTQYFCRTLSRDESKRQSQRSARWLWRKDLLCLLFRRTWGFGVADVGVGVPPQGLHDEAVYHECFETLPGGHQRLDGWSRIRFVWQGEIIFEQHFWVCDN